MKNSIITSLKDYIISNTQLIKSFSQQSYQWRTDCKNREYPILTKARRNCNNFNNALAQFPQRLSRDDVKVFFKQDYYTGVMATLMWGGIHRSRYSSLSRILSVDQNNIETSIKEVDKLLAANDVKGAFSALESGDYHIDGIGISYFTKILFFLSHDKKIKVQPLIYDNIARWIHVALLIDAKAISLKQYYKISKNSAPYGVRKYAELYMDYIVRMNTICVELDLEPDKLEAFLFGVPIHRKGKMTNPRYIVRTYVRNYKDK